MKAIARNLHISPKKMNIVAGLVRKSLASDAIKLLRFIPKKGAKLLAKVIASAMANAENNLGQKKEHLIINQIIVTEGPVMKRFIPASRGRALPILKRSSHVTVDLSLMTDAVEGKTKKMKKETKTEVKKEKKVSEEKNSTEITKPTKKKKTPIKTVKA